MPGEQLDLFGFAKSKTARRVSPEPAVVGQDVVATAAALPPEVRIGTSSWSFPGWRGIVYAAEHSAEMLARRGLTAYADHPLLRCVGIDRTFYAPVDCSVFAEYAGAVGDDFRFLVKAHEHCTLARFPKHARYGADAGERNRRFLDSAYAIDRVVGPAVDGLGDKLGVLLFQCPPQHTATFGGPSAFAERLGQFLSALPRGPRYAVEVRNPELLSDEYAAALADAGATHCLNVHPTMPPVAIQAQQVGHGDATIIRWMLHSGYRYEEAKAHYEPFNRLVDPDPEARAMVARLCSDAARERRQAFVIINNKAEGSAPLSAFALAAEIAALARGDTT